MPGRIPDKIIDEINHRVHLVDVVSETVQLKRQGSRYLGLCPFHQEKTPSFTVDPERQLFYCFGCQAGGNLFGYVQKRDHLTFVEAVHQLAEQAGIALPEQEGNDIDDAKLKKRQQLLDVCQSALEYYRHQLQFHAESKTARQYLIKRQLEDITIDRFQLGYAPSGWRGLTDHLLEKGYPISLMEEAGLTVKQTEGEGYYDRFRERIIFPIFDIRGRCIAFGGRVLYEEQPKYLNSPQTPLFDKGRSLYGIHLLQNQKTNTAIVVFEGYMDLITAWQGNLRYGVASLGTALTLDQCRLMKRYTSTVILCYDADSAGQRATQRGMQLLRQVGLQVLIARIPDGKDPDDFIRNHGGESFQKNVIESALPMYQYYLEILKTKHDVLTAEGKSAYVRDFAAILSQSDSPVEIDAYVRQLAQFLQITENAIYHEIQNLQKVALGSPVPKEGTKQSIDEIKSSNKQKKQIGPRLAQETLLRMALQHKNFATLLTQTLTRADFDSMYQPLIDEFWSGWQEGIHRPLHEQAFSQHEELSSMIARLSLEDTLVDVDLDKAFQDCIAYINDRKLRVTLQELTMEFENQLSAGDTKKMTETLEQIQAIQRKLGRQR